MSIQKHALAFADLKSKINYLECLYEDGDLNDTQQEYISDFSNYLFEELEEFEYFLFEVDGEGDYHENVSEISKGLITKPSTDFLQEINTQLSNMDI